MTRISYPARPWRPVAGVWLALSGLTTLLPHAAWASDLAHARPSAPPPLHVEPPAADWATVNAQVAQFPRGHADVLAAERKLTGQQPLPILAPALPALPDAQALVRTTVRNRPDLWTTAGDGAVDLAGKQAATAAASRDVLMAWWEAAAAAQEAQITAQQQEAAELGNELADRMARAGNWSEAQRLQQVQTLLTAQADHQQALQRAHDTWQQLWPLAGAHPPAVATVKGALPPTTPTATTSPLWTQLPPLPGEADREAALTALAQRPDWQRAHTEWQRAVAALPPGQYAQLTQTLDHWLTAALPTTPAHTATGADTPPQWPQVLTTPPVVDRRTLVLPPQWDRAMDAQARWQRLDSQLRLQTLQAWQRLHTAWATAQMALNHQLPTARAQEQQAQTRYNGMLASTWDLLEATRTRLATQRQAVQTMHNAALAWTDWQAVRAGADPALRDLSAPTPTGAPAADAQGH